MQEQVMVTGATGFVAAQLIRELNQGYRVRGSVRSTLKDLDWLRGLPKAERLALFEAELLNEGDFDSACDGASCVMHTASPYALTVKDPQKDLVEPAVQGTLNVLRAASKSKTVKRVVLTSSVAAMTDEPDVRTRLNEESWNRKSSLKRNPYYYSKTMAERAAWDFMKEAKPRFSLVVINPFLVIGPSLGPQINTSNQIFVDLLTGKYPAILDLAWGMVDVRDVALAHVLAMMTPKAKGRYLCAASTMHMREVPRERSRRRVSPPDPQLREPRRDTHDARAVLLSAEWCRQLSQDPPRSHAELRQQQDQARARPHLPAGRQDPPRHRRRP